MADLLSAKRELRYLDEKRLLGQLAPAEQLRWEELRQMISPGSPAPGPAPAAAVPAPAPVPLPQPRVSYETGIAATFISPPPSAPEPTVVEPPFVDADLTEDTAVAEAAPDVTEVAPGSAFDRAPIPQAPVGQEPMLLEVQHPAMDYESTQAAMRPHSDFEATTVAPMPLTATAVTAPVEQESTMAGPQAVAIDPGFDDPAVAPAPTLLMFPIPPPPAEPTSVIPPAAIPWRESPSAVQTQPGASLDAVEAAFFSGYDTPAAPAAAPSVQPTVPVEEAPPAAQWLPPTPVPTPTPPPAPLWSSPSSAPIQQTAPEEARQVPVLTHDGAPPPAAPETVVAPYVTGLQKVVVHTLEGLQTRGYLSDADLTRGAILLQKQDGGEKWFNIEELKAVFFMVPPDQQPNPAQGSRVAVVMRDGRILHGNAADPSGQGVGFFLFPDEGNARVDRIFIYLQAVKEINPA
jgi:hypothetical protein